VKNFKTEKEKCNDKEGIIIIIIIIITIIILILIIIIIIIKKKNMKIIYWESKNILYIKIV